MKYYRMKNPNWDGKNPNYEWRIAVTIQENGVEKFITLVTTNGQRHVETMPVDDCVIVPARYQLDKGEFHMLRNYINCLGVATMEEVTEEQVKAEETIDINSGFDWLYEDRKESLRLDAAKGKSNHGSANSNSGSASGRNVGNGNPFAVPKSNIFGTGRDLGTFTSRTPTLGTPIGNPKSFGYTADGDIKSAQEILDELRALEISFGHAPAFSIKPDGKVIINVGSQAIELDHAELHDKLTKGK